MLQLCRPVHDFDLDRGEREALSAHWDILMIMAVGVAVTILSLQRLLDLAALGVAIAAGGGKWIEDRNGLFYGLRDPSQSGDGAVGALPGLSEDANVLSRAISALGGGFQRQSPNRKRAT